MEIKSVFRHVLAVLMALCLVLALQGCSGTSSADTKSQLEDTSPGEEPDAIRIGVLFPFSGTLVCDGTYLKAAADLAALEINQVKLFGKEIKIIAEDTETNPDKAAPAARRLIDQGVVAIIGAVASSSTMKAAKEVTIPEGILMISPASTSPAISGLDDHGLVWRTVPSDIYQGKIAAHYAFNEEGKKTAGILFMDNAYGAGLAEAFRAEFERLGGTVMNYVSYPEMTSSQLVTYNFYDDITSLIHERPELLYLITYTLDGAKITQVAKELLPAEYHPQIMGADAQLSNVFLVNSDQDVVNGMIGTVPAPSYEDPNYEKFALQFKILWGVEPLRFSENVYDALYLIAYSMLRAGTWKDSAAIAANITAVSASGDYPIGVNQLEEAKAQIEAGGDIDYDGASGPLEFDANGDLTSGSYLIWKIEDNAFVEVDFVTFSDGEISYSAQGQHPHSLASTSGPLCR